MNKESRRAVWGLLGLLAMFAVSRFLVIFTAVENISWVEELGVGTLARELILGLKSPLLEYQLDTHSGESIVLGLMAVPFFKWLGPNLLALKMVPLTCSLLTVSLAAFFLSRWLGIRTALWAVLFWIFSPPVFVSHSVMILGHSEVLLITMLMLCAFYEFLFSEKKNPLFLFFFGILGGFGFWFYYASAVAFLACLLVWACLRPRSFFSGHLVLVILSFAAGLIPWIFTNQAHGNEGLQWFVARVGVNPFERLPAAGRRLAEQIFSSLPKTFTFLSEKNPLRNTAAGVYFVSFLAAILPLLRSKFEEKKLFFFVYPAVFLLVYALIEVPVSVDYFSLIDFRFYTPFYFFGIILFAMALAEGKFLKVPFALFLIFSVAAQSCLYFREPAGRARHYAGYSYVLLGSRWEKWLSLDENIYRQMSRRASLFAAPENKFVFWGMSLELWQRVSFRPNPAVRHITSLSFDQSEVSSRPFLAEMVSSFIQGNCPDCKFERLVHEGEALPPEDVPYFFKGLLADYYGLTAARVLHGRKIFDAVDPAYRHWIYWGAGNFFQTNPREEQEELQKFVSGLNSQELKWYYRGAGSAVFAKSQPLITADQDYARTIRDAQEKVPEEYKNDFYWGAGWQIRMLFPEDNIRAEDWLLRVPESFRPAAAEGFQACAVWYGLA